MAMRNHGVETKGLYLSINEFTKLLKDNIDNINNKFELEDWVQELLDDIDNYDFSALLDFVYNIEYGTIICEFEGYCDNELTMERTYFDGDDIVILELKKNSLYDKYENKEEIINELKETLSKVGIIVDNDYINKHFGFICGSYYA